MGPTLIVASLDAIHDAPPDAVIWGPQVVAAAVLRHASRLPIARTLRVRGADDD